MSKRQQLLSLYSMLEHCAREASQGGHGLVATLSAAAAEAAREQIAMMERPERRAMGPAGRKERVPVESLA